MSKGRMSKRLHSQQVNLVGYIGETCAGLTVQVVEPGVVVSDLFK